MGYCVLHAHHYVQTCIHCAAGKRVPGNVPHGVPPYDKELLLPPTVAGGDIPALPTDSAERKRWPMFSGLLRYYPSALARVAHHSFMGNEKHNPGLPLQHARGKSGDHEDCIVRHLVDASEHPKGSAARLDELSALCWRALALLQENCEAAGHRVAPAATFDKESNASN